jgi:hypothetical protein
MVRLEPGIIEPTSTLTIPDWVTVDGTGVTVRPQHNEDVFVCGPRGRFMRGMIEMGNSGAVAILNDSTVGDSYAHKWGGGPVRTVVTAEPGSGATGHEVRKPPGGGTCPYLTPMIETHGVDMPLRLRSQGSDGFITSTNASLVASDFREAIVVDGDRNCSNCFVRYNLQPSERSERAKLIDGPTKKFVTEGSISDPSKLSEIVRIEQAFDLGGGTMVGINSMLSYDGLSSDRDSGLVVDTTEAQDTRVIDFSSVWGSPSRSRRRADIGTQVGKGSRVRSRISNTQRQTRQSSASQQQSEEPAIIVEPGDLQSALNDGAAENRIVRCRNGGEFDLGGVTAPEGVTLDARGAMFSLSGDATGLSYRSGATSIGGHVDATDAEGSVLAIEAGAGETVNGPTGPLQTFVDARPHTSPCSGLSLHAYDGGVIDGAQTLARTFLCDTAIEVHAEAGSTIRNCDVYATSAHANVFVYQHDEGEQAGNAWFGHNQPHKNEARSQWHVDAPNAHDEWLEGYMWDPHRMARPWVVWIEQAAGNIRYANPQTYEQGQSNEFFKFIDESNSSGNRPIALPLTDFDDRADIQVRKRRFSTWRFADEAERQLAFA